MGLILSLVAERFHSKERWRAAPGKIGLLFFFFFFFFFFSIFSLPFFS